MIQTQCRRGLKPLGHLAPSISAMNADYIVSKGDDVGRFTAGINLQADTSAVT